MKFKIGDKVVLSGKGPKYLKQYFHGKPRKITDYTAGPFPYATGYGLHQISFDAGELKLAKK